MEELDSIAMPHLMPCKRWVIFSAIFGYFILPLAKRERILIAKVLNEAELKVFPSDSD
jgi:hypothetical protein